MSREQGIREQRASHEPTLPSSSYSFSYSYSLRLSPKRFMDLEQAFLEQVASPPRSP
jgi:hypothetical protein